MTVRHTVAPVAGLIVFGLLTLGVAAWLLWWSSGLLIEVNHFYTSLTGDGTDANQETLYWNRVSNGAYLMQLVSGALLAATVLAVVSAIAVLAFRWDREQAA